MHIIVSPINKRQHTILQLPFGSGLLFLIDLKLVRILTFPSSRQVVGQRLKSPVCPTIYP